jgi:hypothetical protein
MVNTASFLTKKGDKMCKECDWIEKVFGVPQSNREYWLMTEVFVKLHNGKDYCNVSSSK